jgi:hypothetical protein
MTLQVPRCLCNHEVIFSASVLAGAAASHTDSLTVPVAWGHGQIYSSGDAPERRRSRTAVPQGVRAAGRTSRMSGRGGKSCGCWPKARQRPPSPRAPATPAPGLARSPSATASKGQKACRIDGTPPPGARRACSRPSSRRNCARRWRARLLTEPSAGGRVTSRIGWQSHSADRWPRSAAGTISNASSTVSRCPDRATPWPMSSSKTASKKIETAAPSGGHGVSPCPGRTVGHR